MTTSPGPKPVPRACGACVVLWHCGCTWPYREDSRPSRFGSPGGTCAPRYITSLLFPKDLLRVLRCKLRGDLAIVGSLHILKVSPKFQVSKFKCLQILKVLKVSKYQKSPNLKSLQILKVSKSWVSPDLLSLHILKVLNNWKIYSQIPSFFSPSRTKSGCKSPRLRRSESPPPTEAPPFFNWVCLKWPFSLAPLRPLLKCPPKSGMPHDDDEGFAFRSLLVMARVAAVGPDEHAVSGVSEVLFVYLFVVFSSFFSLSLSLGFIWTFFSVFVNVRLFVCLCGDHVVCKCFLYAFCLTCHYLSFFCVFYCCAQEL